MDGVIDLAMCSVSSALIQERSNSHVEAEGVWQVRHSEVVSKNLSGFVMDRKE